MGLGVQISHLPPKGNNMSHKQVIVVRRDLNMRKGKIAAQAAHASLAAILSQGIYDQGQFTLALDDRLAPWLQGEFKKICVYVNSEAELLAVYERAREADLICSLIQDNGLTEFQGVKTYTAVAVGPDCDERVDAITGDLPLY